MVTGYYISYLKYIYVYPVSVDKNVIQYLIKKKKTRVPTYTHYNIIYRILYDVHKTVL